MTLLKTLTQLNESLPQEVFYVVNTNDNPQCYDLADAIFHLFGYKDVGTVAGSLSKEMIDTIEDLADHPKLEHLTIFAKPGITGTAFGPSGRFAQKLIDYIEARQYVN